MSLSDPIPVRFSEETDARLSRMAERSGLSKAELIRLATDDYLEKISSTGQIVQTIRLREEPAVYRVSTKAKGKGSKASTTIKP